MIELKIDFKDLAKLKELPNKILSKALFEDIGQYMVSSTQRKIKTGIEPINSPLTRAWKKGGLQLRDTGRLMSSISHKADEHSVTIGTNVIYGRIQQLGGIIRPKKAKKLWIPSGWQTRKLMRRFGHTPSAVMKGMKAAGYKLWQSKSGKAMLASKEKGKKPFVVFVLKDKVEIPARRYLNIDAMDRNIIIQKVGQCLKSS